MSRSHRHRWWWVYRKILGPGHIRSLGHGWIWRSQRERITRGKKPTFAIFRPGLTCVKFSHQKFAWRWRWSAYITGTPDVFPKQVTMWYLHLCVFCVHVCLYARILLQMARLLSRIEEDPAQKITWQDFEAGTDFEKLINTRKLSINCLLSGYITDFAYNCSARGAWTSHFQRPTKV